MPSRSFFVLDARVIYVKIKKRTKQENYRCCDAAQSVQFLHSSDLANRRISVAEDTDASPLGAEQPQNQALGCARKKQHR
jgi:hypothetical protein